MSTRASFGATRAINARSSSIARLTPTSGSLGPSASCRRRFSARVRASSSAPRIATSSPSGVTGFSRNWNAPSFVARTASVRLALPLIITTGTSGATRFSCSSVASPSGPPGIIRSSSTASGAPRSTAASAAVPLLASAGSKPSDCSSAPPGGPPPPPRLGGVGEGFTQGGARGFVVPRRGAPPAVGFDGDLHALGHRRAAQLLEQLHDIHFALRPFGEAAEIRELPRQPLQAIGLGREDFHGHLRPPAGGGRLVRDGRRESRTVPPQLIHRDPHRRERVLDLVGHTARHLPECPQPLRLELLPARGVERTRELAQPLSQRLEVGSAARRLPRGQWLAPPDQPRPADQLVDP